jgi:hypothetical protein
MFLSGRHWKNTPELERVGVGGLDFKKQGGLVVCDFWEFVPLQY